MAKNQKSYTPEFKQQIVDLHCQAGKGVTELSNEYGIPKGTVSTWIKNLAPVAVSDTETISLKEYKALQKKMKELEIENEILKKATAIFAKNQQLNTCPLFRLTQINILLNKCALHLNFLVALITLLSTMFLLDVNKNTIDSAKKSYLFIMNIKNATEQLKSIESLMIKIFLALLKGFSVI